MGNLIEVLPTLHRWLAGERIGPLPMRGADQAPPELSFEFFPPRTEVLEQQLWTCIQRLAPPPYKLAAYESKKPPRRNRLRIIRRRLTDNCGNQDSPARRTRGADCGTPPGTG
jgi:hypothetical protein